MVYASNFRVCFSNHDCHFNREIHAQCVQIWTESSLVVKVLVKACEWL